MWSSLCMHIAHKFTTQQSRSLQPGSHLKTAGTRYDKPTNTGRNTWYQISAISSFATLAQANDVKKISEHEHLINKRTVQSESRQVHMMENAIEPEHSVFIEQSPLSTSAAQRLVAA